MVPRLRMPPGVLVLASLVLCSTAGALTIRPERTLTGRPEGSELMTVVPAKWDWWVEGAVKGTGLPWSVVAWQINDESSFDPNVTSSAGAEGIAQFIPSTWASLGISGSPFNPQDALRGYIKLMTELLNQFHGNVRNALAAYNAGPGNLAAGYGYADTILSQAGEPSTLTVKPGSGVVPVGLVNPLENAVITANGRVDEGVDFDVNGGYLRAIGPGVVTYSQLQASGWPGGQIQYQIKGVPGLDGAYIYYAEGVYNLQPVGTPLQAGDHLCNLYHGSSIEIGFGSNNPPDSYSRALGFFYDQHNSTRAGILFNELLKELGGPVGYTTGNPAGPMPPFSIAGFSASSGGPIMSSQQFVDAILADDWAPWLAYGVDSLAEYVKLAHAQSSHAIDDARSMSVFTESGGR